MGGDNGFVFCLFSYRCVWTFVVGWLAEKVLNKTEDSIAPCETSPRIGNKVEVLAPTCVTKF